MADLSEIQASQSIKIAGVSASGLESTYANVTPNQDLKAADIVNTSGVYGTLTVGVSALEVKVGISKLSNRKSVTLDNTSTKTIYWGYDSSISITNFAGRIFKDQQASWTVGDLITIYVIAATASNDVHISEGA